jgi:hypothetical protein
VVKHRIGDRFPFPAGVCPVAITALLHCPARHRFELAANQGMDAINPLATPRVPSEQERPSFLPRLTLKNHSGKGSNFNLGDDGSATSEILDPHEIKNTIAQAPGPDFF